MPGQPWQLYQGDGKARQRVQKRGQQKKRAKQQQLHNVQPVLAKATTSILIVTEKLHMLAVNASLAASQHAKADQDSTLSHTNEMLLIAMSRPI